MVVENHTIRYISRLRPQFRQCGCLYLRWDSPVFHALAGFLAKSTATIIAVFAAVGHSLERTDLIVDAFQSSRGDWEIVTVEYSAAMKLNLVAVEGFQPVTAVIVIAASTACNFLKNDVEFSVVAVVAE